MSMFRIAKPNPYQGLANEMPETVQDSGIVFVGGRPAFEPRGSVGMPAGAVARRTLNADDTNENSDVVRPMVRRDAWAAADQAYASEISQTLVLNGLGRAVAYARPSGSTLRSVRVGRVPTQQELPVSRLGAAAAWFDTVDWATSCVNFDASKVGPAVVGFLFDFADKNPKSGFRDGLEEASKIFGVQPVGCTVAASRKDPSKQAGAQAIVSAIGIKGAVAPSVANVAAGLGMSADDAVRARNAAARLAKLGGFGASGWETKWWLLSGYTPFYLNPLVLASGAIAGMGGYWLFKKKRRK